MGYVQGMPNNTNPAPSAPSPTAIFFSPFLRESKNGSGSTTFIISPYTISNMPSLEKKAKWSNPLAEAIYSNSSFNPTISVKSSSEMVFTITSTWVRRSKQVVSKCIRTRSLMPDIYCVPISLSVSKFFLSI